MLPADVEVNTYFICKLAYKVNYSSKLLRSNFRDACRCSERIPSELMHGNASVAVWLMLCLFIMCSTRCTPQPPVIMIAVEPVKIYPANFIWKMEHQLYMRYGFSVPVKNIICHTSAHIAHLHTVYTSPHINIFVIFKTFYIF